MPAIAVPSDDPRFDTLRDSPEMAEHFFPGVEVAVRSLLAEPSPPPPAGEDGHGAPGPA